jgi:hypothetical protein
LKEYGADEQTSAEPQTEIVAADYAPMMSEPLPETRRPSESWDDFGDRFATALRTVDAYDTRAALVVCDEVAVGRPTPFALDGESHASQGGAARKRGAAAVTALGRS